MADLSQQLQRVCRPRRIESILVPRKGIPQDGPGLFDIRAYLHSGRLVESQLPETSLDLMLKVGEKLLTRGRAALSAKPISSLAHTTIRRAMNTGSSPAVSIRASQYIAAEPSLPLTLL